MLEFDAVLGRTKVFPVLVVLILDHLLNPGNDPQEVAF
jgi:hypothetical protein